MVLKSTEASDPQRERYKKAADTTCSIAASAQCCLVCPIWPGRARITAPDTGRPWPSRTMSHLHRQAPAAPRPHCGPTWRRTRRAGQPTCKEGSAARAGPLRGGASREHAHDGAGGDGEAPLAEGEAAEGLALPEGLHAHPPLARHLLHRSLVILSPFAHAGRAVLWRHTQGPPQQRAALHGTAPRDSRPPYAGTTLSRHPHVVNGCSHA
jgi:hypothetical protein